MRRTIGSRKGRADLMAQRRRVAAVATALSLVLAACSTGAPATPAAPASAPPSAAASPSAAAAQPVKLTVWWWGEQEAPGLEGFMKESVDLFQKQYPNITVEAVLQTTDGIVPAWEAAVAAKSGPDIQYIWGDGNWARAVWNGSVVPLDDLLGAEEINHYADLDRAGNSFDGKLYGVPFYTIGYPWIVNPTLLEKAGIAGGTTPKTLEELLAACDKLNAAGITPIAAGLKDAWYMGFIMPGLFMSLVDSPSEYYEIFTNDKGFDDPRYAPVWDALQQIRDRKCFNDDAGSLDFFSANEKFTREEAAMIPAVQPVAIGFARELGPEKVDISAWPTIGTGKLGGTYGFVNQKLAITSWSRHQAEAALFLKFLHTPERMAAMYEQAGALSLDDRFSAEGLDPLDAKQLQLIRDDGSGGWIQAFWPPQFEYESLYSFGVELLLGTIDANEAVARAVDGMKKWREGHPDEVERYRQTLAAM